MERREIQPVSAGAVEVGVAEKPVVMSAGDDLCAVFLGKLLGVADVVIVTVGEHHVGQLAAVLLDLGVERPALVAGIDDRRSAGRLVNEVGTVGFKRRDAVDLYTYHRFSSLELMSMVTGPSLSSETAISAPKMPFSTFSTPFCFIFSQKNS